MINEEENNNEKPNNTVDYEERKFLLDRITELKLQNIDMGKENNDLRDELETYETKTKESNMIKEEENNNEKPNNNIKELQEIAGVLEIKVTSKEFMAIAVDYIQKKALGIIPDPDADPQDPAPKVAANMRSEEVQKGYTEDLDAVFKEFSFSTHTKPADFKKEHTHIDKLNKIADQYVGVNNQLFSDQYTAQKNARSPGQYYQIQQAAEKADKTSTNEQGAEGAAVPMTVDEIIERLSDIMDQGNVSPDDINDVEEVLKMVKDVRDRGDHVKVGKAMEEAISFLNKMEGKSNSAREKERRVGNDWNFA